MTDVSSQGPARRDDRRVLTNRQGHPVYDNQNQRTVGPRGPATLENYQFLEKISHFDRERIPERVVHARGFVAYGYFEATGKWGDEPITNYTRAKLFAEPGKRTDVAIRLSTVIGGRDSSETARDPRGFAVKFYTEDGNWDLVGNNLAVFFIRDAIKFPDVIHSLKPDPVTFRQEPARIFDFMSQTPEAMHMLVNLFSPRGIPANYRTQQGFGVNTYKWVNAEGVTHLVKYHWIPKIGVKSLTEDDAAAIQAHDLGHASKDMYEAIERGDHPEWELRVQMMSDDDHPELNFDPLDDTKVWPENLYELWPNPELPEDHPDRWLWTCTVLTRPATDAAGHIHERSPVILPDTFVDPWLDPGLNDRDDVDALLNSIPEPTLELYEVSTAVNSPRNNNPDLLRPVDS